MAVTQTVDPTTGDTLATYTECTDAELESTIGRVHAAFGDWRTTSVEHRCGIISVIGEMLRERRDDLADLMTAEMGKVRAQGIDEVELCAAICDWTAEHAPEQLADQELPLEGGRALVTHQPIGIVFGIQPFNFPLYQALRFSVPALAVGNAALLKHSHGVWGSALALEQLYHDAGVPGDVFRTLLISNDQSMALIGDPRIRAVTLTGSPAAGAAVAAEAGRHLKKTVMELGSNDAYLVLSDADLELAVRTSVEGRVVNNGQTCVAAKRFVVVDDVHDRFRDAYVSAMADLIVGDPRDAGTDLGPLADRDLRDTLHDQVMRSVDDGATLVLGGEVPEGPGAFYPATVLTDVRSGMAAYDEELFGPVAVIIRVADDAEAMRVANDSRFGLGGGIFSADEDRAVALAIGAFDTGMVNVNGYHLAQPHLPFGGVKDSGYGREHGSWGLTEFTNVKAVMVSRNSDG